MRKPDELPMTELNFIIYLIKSYFVFYDILKFHYTANEDFYINSVNCEKVCPIRAKGFAWV